LIDLSSTEQAPLRIIGAQREIVACAALNCPVIRFADRRV